MSQHECIAARSLASAWVARPAAVDEGMGDLESVRRRIEAGHAFLKVVEYPWGVEFEVSEVGSQE